MTQHSSSPNKQYGGAIVVFSMIVLFQFGMIPQSVFGAQWNNYAALSNLIALSDSIQQNVHVEIDTTSGDTTRIKVDIRKDLEKAKAELERARKQMDQNKSYDMNLEAMDKALEELDRQLQQNNFEIERNLKNIQVSVHFDDKPYLGLVVQDMDFKDAYEMHYNYNYGVLVQDVIPGSAAEKAGLRKNDIIMKIDNEPVRYKAIFQNIMESTSPGKEFTMTVFRNEALFTTTIKLLSEKSEKATSSDTTAKSPQAKSSDEDWETINWDELKSEKKKQKLSAGSFGGSWLPYYYMGNFDDINGVITQLGFNSLRDNGLLYNGGALKFTIGNGWFLGFAGAGYSLDHKTGYTLSEGTQVTRRMNFSTGFWGGTLDKRYPLSKTFVVGGGFLLGGGGTSLKVAQTSGDYTWPEIQNQLLDPYNNYFELHKSYLLFQPRASLLIRLKSWIGIHSEVGYLLSYSFTNGWTAKLDNETYEIKSSPTNSSYDGWTISVGPWFGF